MSYKDLRNFSMQLSETTKEYSLLNFLKEAAFTSTQGTPTSQIGMGIGLEDTARSYGIRAGKGGTDDRGLAYSQGVLGAGVAGVAGGATAGAAVGKPFVASTLLRTPTRDAAIASAISDYSKLHTAGISDVVSTLSGKKLTISPEVSEILNRRLKAGAGAGAIGFGLGAIGKGIHNMAEYNIAKKLSTPENSNAKTASDMPPFLSQNRSKKVKEIYRALKREHPEYSAGKKARIANAMGKEAEVEYRGKKFPGYNQPIDSDRPEKKKMVLAKKGDQVKLIHFGQKGYKHNYSDAAKKNYLTRSAGIRGKDGSLTANDKFSANYWARRELWPKNEPADGSAKNREKRASNVAIPEGGLRPGLLMNDLTQVMTPEDAQLVRERLPFYERSGPGLLPGAAIGAGSGALLGNSLGEAVDLIKEMRTGDPMQGLGRKLRPAGALAGGLLLPAAGYLSTTSGKYDQQALQAAQDAIQKAREKRASDDDYGHKAELAGLGILAAPYAAHLGAKVPGLRKAAKPVSDFLHDSPSVEHAMELGGLGVLATPSLKHYLEKRKDR